MSTTENEAGQSSVVEETVSNEVSEEQQAKLDAVKEQGMAVKALKEAGAEKDEVLAAVAILNELKIAAGIDPKAGGRRSKKGKGGGGGKQKKSKATKIKSADQGEVVFNANKNEDFPLWFEQICIVAEVIDKRYPVKGMPVFMPYGYYMHDKIMKLIEIEWEDQGIDKAQFPMLIPTTFLEKEEEHVKGFESEVFWVTKGGLNELDIPLALRPTSETAIYHMYSLWIQTYRDLPVKMHQTCNIFRYETKDTRPLIRVREIYWNEAHTAHSTEEEAIQNLEDAWKGYLWLIEDQLGFYGKRLQRPNWDKFAGAEFTHVMDAVLPDGKVLQCVGAHYLGQKFAKVFDITFKNESNEEEYAYMTCYGISTRLLAAMMGLHGDNNGLVLPAIVAKIQVVLVPIIKGDDTSGVDKCHIVKAMLKKAGIRATVDDSPKKPGKKYYFWEMKGVPLRIEIGPGDVEKGEVKFCCRVTRDKYQVKEDDIVEQVNDLFARQIDILRDNARAFAEGQETVVMELDQLEDVIRNKGGFAKVPFFSMDFDAEEADKEIHEVCGGEVRGWDPSEEQPGDDVKCIVTGKPAKYWGYVARAY